jgi:exosortase A-associated hydrolase 1
MSGAEEALAFPCRGDTLVGVLHRGAAGATRGVVIVVGGPQYRAGSHRQFVQFARALAADGVPVLRFDARGMGDSGGSHPGFEALDDDIRAAVDALVAAEPGVERIALWGLCDAASAICWYAPTDARVAGAVLLNPWVRTEPTYAQTQLRHYYGGKLGDPAFWRRLFTGGVNVADAAASLRRTLRNLTKRGDTAKASLPERMAQGVEAFGGPVLLVVSGEDLTAREFEDAAAASDGWQRLFASPRFARLDLPQADHTFSRRGSANAVARRTSDWVRGL